MLQIVEHFICRAAIAVLSTAPVLCSALWRVGLAAVLAHAHLLLWGALQSVWLYKSIYSNTPSVWLIPRYSTWICRSQHISACCSHDRNKSHGLTVPCRFRCSASICKSECTGPWMSCAPPGTSEMRWAVGCCARGRWIGVKWSCVLQSASS